MKFDYKPNRRIILLKEIDSTNNYIKNNLKDFDDGTVVIAESQTAGRGRYSKSFVSTYGGLYMSVLFRPIPNELLTVIAGVCVSEALREYDINAEIKWVNDIYCKDKKVCGILTEAVNGSAVTGIGINIGNTELPDTAASLYDLYGFEIKKEKLAENILNKFDKYLSDFMVEDIIEKYKRYSYVLNKEIVFENGEGIAADILNNGNLVVRTKERGEIVLNSGMISIKLKGMNG